MCRDEIEHEIKTIRYEMQRADERSANKIHLLNAMFEAERVFVRCHIHICHLKERCEYDDTTSTRKWSAVLSNCEALRATQPPYIKANVRRATRNALSAKMLSAKRPMPTVLVRPSVHVLNRQTPSERMAHKRDRTCSGGTCADRAIKNCNCGYVKV